MWYLIVYIITDWVALAVACRCVSNVLLSPVSRSRGGLALQIHPSVDAHYAGLHMMILKNSKTKSVIMTCSPDDA